MSTVEEIKAAIAKLSLEQKAEIARWFHGWSDDEWDRQIADDAAAGRLGTLLAQVDRDIKSGQLKDLP
jgi:hypothetical protein